MYDIKGFAFDILIFIYCNTIDFDVVFISSVQRASKLNIVPDVDSEGIDTLLSSIHYQVFKERFFLASSILYPISYTISFDANI